MDPWGRTTVAALVEEGERVLEGAGIPAARLEAEVLLARRLGVERSGLLARWTDPVPPAAGDGFRGDLHRRASRYPIQYITGMQEFHSLEFEVDERVLIPRHETEMLVDAVLERAPREGPVTIVDVGTGSGNIAVTLAMRLPGALVFACDLSPAALDVARRNAERHGVADRVRCLAGDGLQPALAEGLGGRADFVVSNPPYIAEHELDGVQPELSHEPRMALSPGPDGMSVTRSLIEAASAVLRPGGWLFVELSIGCADRALRLLGTALWESVLVAPDIQGIPRVLGARRRA